jgi:hypothetical protein
MAELPKMAKIYDKYCSGPKPAARYITLYIEECKFYLLRF